MLFSVWLNFLVSTEVYSSWITFRFRLKAFYINHSSLSRAYYVIKSFIRNFCDKMCKKLIKVVNLSSKISSFQIYWWFLVNTHRIAHSCALSHNLLKRLPKISKYFVCLTVNYRSSTSVNKIMTKFQDCLNLFHRRRTHELESRANSVRYSSFFRGYQWTVWRRYFTTDDKKKF